MSKSRWLAGFTLLEVLVVTAIIGVVAGLSAFEGRRVAAGREERAAVTSIRQMFWQGATAAASRGLTAELVRSGPDLIIRSREDGRELRRTTLPASVSTDLPEGTLLYFGAPGRVCFTPPPACSSDPRDAAFPNPFAVLAGRRTSRLTVSLIGDVSEESLP